ncbi:MAG: glycosyltransferase family 4 protein [Leptospiraceae bacterium]|nr:glycosyltransferase family 4 protein [Leptospiraceae bacterium]
MKIKRIHQFSTGFHHGDAISNEMLMIQKVLKSKGIEGEIFAENLGLSETRKVKKFNTYTSRSEEMIIYHHSIHSSVLSFILKQNVPKILIYHNVTPHIYFQPYDLKMTFFLKQGREDLKYIKDEFLFCFADSEYNRSELIDLGYSDVTVLPIIYDFSKLTKRKVPKENRIKQILFVGRIAPNKKQDDLIRFASIYNKYFSKDFIVNLVGHCSPEMQLYQNGLKGLLRELNISDKVFFSSFVTDEQVNRYYQEADLFLSMSEHEGFCVPLLESMFHEIPIMAYDAGAVKETLSGSGILFYEKKFEIIAELAYKLLYDPEFRFHITSKQNTRLQEFKSIKPEELFLKKLKDERFINE